MPTHTHTHTHANAPWLTCAMESFLCNAAIAAVSSPRSPPRLHPTTVGGGAHGTSAIATAQLGLARLAPPSLLLAECSTSQRYFALSLVALALLFVISCLGPSHDRECFPPCPSPHSHRPCPGPFRGEGPRPCACMSLSLIHESGPHARAFIPDSRQFKASGLLLDKLPT